MPTHTARAKGPDPSDRPRRRRRGGPGPDPSRDARPVEQARSTAESPRWDAHAWRVAALLVVAVVAAFLPILKNDFVAWDDDKNFLENPHYQGLGGPQVAWAWTTYKLGVYQPVSWMILEAEYAASALDPWGYHLTSLVLYAADTVLLCRLTLALLARCRPIAPGEDARDVAIAAGLAVAAFAVHPLRVEVVAWASCQPYLPCAFFAMLSVLAYLKAHDGTATPRAVWLVGSFALFAAALLCKAVAVSLPVVLLILDAYPLRRLGGGPRPWLAPGARRVWLEKLPFFALSVPFAMVALRAKASDHVLVRFENYGLGPRIAQACYGATFYLAKTVAPFGINAFYPLNERPDPFRSPYAFCVALVAGLTVAAALLRRRWPGLLAAWAAYLAILAPNLGLARIGDQIAADRYSYLASMGLVVLLAAGLARLLRAGGTRRAAALVGSMATILVLTALTWGQCRAWRTTETLWTHVLEQGTGPNKVAHKNLGTWLYHQGRRDEAEAHYVEALKIDPDDFEAHYNRATLRVARGELDEAEAELAEVAHVRPDHADALYNLGYIQYRRGRFDEASARFSDALRIDPDHALARVALEKANRKRQASGP